MTFLAELPESHSTGRTREIYEEMKYLGGVPMVALIFRHLATLPSGIEWVWDAIGPAWKTGRLQEEAWRIARQAPMEPIAAIPREALAALDVDAAGLREIRTVCEAYNRANPQNMLTVLCLMRLLGGANASRGIEARAWTPPPAPGPLPAMADVATMPREVTDLLELVAAPAEPGSTRVVQSLYRHFVHRPQFLALAITLLLQRFRDGSIDRSVAAIAVEMNAAADAIARSLTAPPAPHEGIAVAFRRFGGGVIPQMIVVGRLLEEALPPR